MLTSDVWAQLAAPFPVDALTRQQLRHDLTENRVLVVPRVALKALYARLDEVFGQANWSLTFEARAGAMVCGLSLRVHASEWVCKQGVAPLGAGTAKTAALAAANEAAAAWGIARELLSAAPAWVDASQPEEAVDASSLPPFSSSPDLGPVAQAAQAERPLESVETPVVATKEQPAAQEAAQAKGDAADESQGGVVPSDSASCDAPTEPAARTVQPGTEQPTVSSEPAPAAPSVAESAVAATRSPRKQRGSVAAPAHTEPAVDLATEPAADAAATGDEPESVTPSVAGPGAANDALSDGPAQAGEAADAEAAEAEKAPAAQPLADCPADASPSQFAIAPEVLADLDVATRAYVDQLIDYASAPGGLRLGIIRDTLTRGKAREKLRDRYPLVLKALLELVEDRARAHQQKAA